MAGLESQKNIPFSGPVSYRWAELSYSRCCAWRLVQGFAPQACGFLEVGAIELVAGQANRTSRAFQMPQNQRMLRINALGWQI